MTSRGMKAGVGRTRTCRVMDVKKAKKTSRLQIVLTGTGRQTRALFDLTVWCDLSDLAVSQLLSGCCRLLLITLSTCGP